MIGSNSMDAGGWGGRLRAAVLVLSLYGLANLSFAIPRNVAVTGALLDPDEQPLEGTFDMLVLFHDQPSTETTISTLSTVIDVRNGLFTAAVPVPDEIITLERAWYSVAVDVDSDGFDRTDFFHGLHEVYSVPFSLSGAPVDIFETSGGHRISFTGASKGPFVPNTLILVPFSTPPGGVRFNRLAIRAAFAGTSSYGIYDVDGGLVVSTQGREPDILNDPFIFDLDGRLQPSHIYFAAYTSDAEEYPLTRISAVPTLPGVGRILLGGVDGLLPDSIELDQVQGIGSEPTLSFGLFYVDDAGPSLLSTPANVPVETLAPEIQEMIANLKRTSKRNGR
jgi:hypothetical protein